MEISPGVDATLMLMIIKCCLKMLPRMTTSLNRQIGTYNDTCDDPRYSLSLTYGKNMRKFLSVAHLKWL